MVTFYNHSNAVETIECGLDRSWLDLCVAVVIYHVENKVLLARRRALEIRGNFCICSLSLFTSMHHCPLCPDSRPTEAISDEKKTMCTHARLVRRCAVSELLDANKTNEATRVVSQCYA